MKTVETTAEVTPDHRLLLDIPSPGDLRPGAHRVVVVIEEQETRPADTLDDFPVIDVGLWPKDLPLSREEIYGDDGR